MLGPVLELLYFMLPAYAANMTPPFLSAVLVTFLQSRIAWDGSLVPSEQWLELGLRFGIGAMTGDSAKSFVKRRLGIAPGEPWIPFDQLDFVIGALVLTWSQASLSLLDCVLILVSSAAGHILVTHLGCWLRIRDTKW